MAREPKHIDVADEKIDVVAAQPVADEAPSPTQAELDAAKLAALGHDAKEDDAPEPKKAADVEPRAVRSEHAAPYRNRAAKTE